MKDQEAIQRGIRIRIAEKGARATIETRVALIVAERGLTERQLAKFYVSRRKNCKPRFDYWAFAEAHGISTDWIFHGDIRSYPLAPSAKPIWAMAYTPLSTVGRSGRRRKRRGRQLRRPFCQIS